MTQSQVFACTFCDISQNSCYQDHSWLIAWYKQVLFFVLSTLFIVDLNYYILS